MHRFQALLNRKNSMKNGEEGYKIQSRRYLFFKKIDVKAKKEEKLTH
jgi:hypothetical protein